MKFNRNSTTYTRVLYYNGMESKLPHSVHSMGEGSGTLKIRKHFDGCVNLMGLALLAPVPYFAFPSSSTESHAVVGTAFIISLRFFWKATVITQLNF